MNKIMTRFSGYLKLNAGKLSFIPWPTNWPMTDAFHHSVGPSVRPLFTFEVH